MLKSCNNKEVHSAQTVGKTFPKTCPPIHSSKENHLSIAITFLQKSIFSNYWEDIVDKISWVCFIVFRNFMGWLFNVQESQLNELFEVQSLAANLQFARHPSIIVQIRKRWDTALQDIWQKNWKFFEHQNKGSKDLFYGPVRCLVVINVV